MPVSRQNAQALAGLRILDLSRILAGPTATQLLGDLGADVIKVERPGTGDDTRGWGPPFVPDETGAASDLSAYYLAANRNKRSIAIDLAHPAGQALTRDLMARADVVIENYKPGDLARYGLDYNSVKTRKPDLVWCAISGFGQTGPYAARTGYDFLIQAMGGLMSITGEADGAPMKAGVGIADVMCGMYATVGILAALRHRDATGEGQMIDLALYDTQLSWLINAATNTLLSGATPGRIGNRHPNIAPYQTFVAADGHLALAVGNDAQFRRLCAVLGVPGLADDARFLRNRDRVENRDALEAALAPLFAQRPVDRWVEALVAVGVPTGPVASVAEALGNPHTRARDMVIAMDNPLGGEPLQLLGNPLKLSATPPAYRLPPPQLDADREHILRDVLGLDGAAVAALEAAGAFGSNERHET